MKLWKEIIHYPISIKKIRNHDIKYTSLLIKHLSKNVSANLQPGEKKKKGKLKRVRGTRPAHVQENWCTQHEWTLKNHREYTENPQIPHRVNKKREKIENQGRNYIWITLMFPKLGKDNV